MVMNLFTRDVTMLYEMRDKILIPNYSIFSQVGKQITCLNLLRLGLCICDIWVIPALVLQSASICPCLICTLYDIDQGLSLRLSTVFWKKLVISKIIPLRCPERTNLLLTAVKININTWFQSWEIYMYVHGAYFSDNYHHRKIDVICDNMSCLINHSN